jgi:hypothetical protein
LGEGIDDELLLDIDETLIGKAESDPRLESREKTSKTLRKIDG